MTPTAPVYIGTDYFDGMIHGLEQKIEDANQLGMRLSEFLCAAFPLAAQQGIALGGAVATFLVSGDAEHIDALKSQRAAGQYFRNSPIERLAEMCKQRDRLQEQIDQAEATIEKCKGTPMEDIMALGVKTMMSSTQQQLDYCNEAIAELQREMEKEPA
jgi:hypothetical protein